MSATYLVGKICITRANGVVLPRRVLSGHDRRVRILSLDGATSFVEVLITLRLILFYRRDRSIVVATIDEHRGRDTDQR